MDKLIEITDLKTPKGLEGFNNFLAQHSYVKGYQASKADIAVLELLSKAPSSDYPHIVRWYNHIKSFDATVLPGEKKVPEFFKSESSKPTAAAAADDDDDVDLFGSDDEEDAEEAKIREERLKAYAERKSKKPAIIAKSSIVIDVKPWGDETDLKKMEEAVRSIVQDGLVWGASKLVPVGYGIKKLQIMCVVEDEKVSVDAIVEQIQDFEEHVQSVDIAAFNKI